MLPVSKAARLRAARRHPRHVALTRRLLATDASVEPEAIFENWVRMWLDPRPVHRGITWDGRDMWLVRHAEKRFGYHAEADSPDTAIAQALSAWEERRRVKRNWPQVQRIARDLMLGRRRLEVRIEDAHASALCTVGIEGFLSRIGLGRVRRISGRTAALLMLIEPQVGFVILAAHERVHGPIADRQTRTPARDPLRLA
jgi:hypothetical protein